MRYSVLVGLSSLVVAWSAVRSDAQSPIPSGPDCYTRAQFHRDLYATRLRRFQAYEQHTQDPVELKAGGLKFMADYNACALGLPGCSKWDAVVAAGKSLRDRGSQDPLVYLFYLRARSQVDHQAPFETEVWKCFDQLALSTYPDVWKMRPIQLLFSQWTKRVPKGRPTSRELVAKSADAWIREPNVTESDRRDRWLMISGWFDELDIEHKEVFYRTCDQYAAADPWLLNLLAGEYYVALAWHHRGGGYADTVTEVGNLNFRDNLRLAVRYLEFAWQIDPKLPEAAASAVTAAMGGAQTATAREWFDRAVAAQMDYGPVYRAYLWNLRPRWHGSLEEMIAFGRECLATKRFDTLVPQFFLESVFKLQDEVRTNNRDSYAVFRNPEIWADLDTAYAGFLAHGDRGYGLGETPGFVSQWLLVSLFSSRYDEALAKLQIIEERGWELSEREIGHFSHYPESVHAMLAGLRGPAAGTVREILDLLQQPRQVPVELRDDALTKLEVVLASDSNELVQEFFGRWRRTTSWERDYDADRWVDLTFDSKLTGWKATQGSWQVQDDGGIVAAMKPKEAGVELRCLARFEPPYEIRAKISLPKGCKKPVAAGFYIFEEGGEYETSRFFWLSPLQRRGGQNNYGQYPDGTQAVIHLQEPNDVIMRVWPNQSTWFINGWDCSLALPTDEVLRDRFRLTSVFVQDRTATIRFSDVRVRRLHRPAPPPESDSAAMLAYYTESLTENPDDFSAYWKRGRAQLGVKDVAAAIRDFDAGAKQEPRIAHLQFSCGVARELAADYALAIDRYTQALAIDDGHLNALKRLAWVCATCSEPHLRDGSKALEAAQKACELTSHRDADAWQCLSASYAELGRHDEAIAAAKRALILAPKVPKEQESLKAFLKRREARQPETSGRNDDEQKTIPKSSLPADDKKPQ